MFGDYVIKKFGPPLSFVWGSISIGGELMQRINQYNFYMLGTILTPLKELKEKSVLGDFYYPLSLAKSWLNYLGNDQLVPFTVSKTACYDLLKAISNLLEAEEGEVSPDLEKELDFMEAYSVTHALDTFETVFSAELQNLDTYFVMQKLAYVTHDLIESGEKVLSSIVIAKLPQEAIDDIRQATRCIAFELPTGAGFHIMRATEKVLRIYYEFILNTKVENKNWGICIEDLKKCEKADQKILSTFDQIRTLHRNPLMHPEVFLDLDEALILFDIAKSAIISMTNEIIKLEGVKSALPLQ